MPLVRRCIRLLLLKHLHLHVHVHVCIQRVTYSSLTTPRLQRSTRMTHTRSTSTDNSKLPITRPVRIALLLLGLSHNELSPRIYFSSLSQKSENRVRHTYMDTHTTTQKTLMENTQSNVHIIHVQLQH